MAAASALLVALLARERRAPKLNVSVIVAAIVIVAASALVRAPIESRDAWQYAMYGRIVSVHHANPYTEPPASFTDDALYPQLSSRWLDTPTVYGPGFTALSAGITWVAGSNATLTRLGFQLVGLAAFGAVLVLVWRHTRSRVALLALGVNPLLVVHIVNGAHNDLLLGLAILCAALLIIRDHPLWAGVALGLGANVKLTALIGVAWIAAWIALRSGVWFGTRVAALAVAIAGLPYLAFGGLRALSGLQANSALSSHGAVWRLLPRWGLPAVAPRVASIVALSVIVVLGLFVVWRRNAVVTLWVPLAMFCLVAAYVLPWYFAWVLPTLALAIDEVRSRIVFVYALFFASAYQVFWRSRTESAGIPLRPVLEIVVPLVTLATAVALFVVIARRPVDDDRGAPEWPRLWPRRQSKDPTFDEVPGTAQQHHDLTLETQVRYRS